MIIRAIFKTGYLITIIQTAVTTFSTKHYVNRQNLDLMGVWILFRNLHILHPWSITYKLLIFSFKFLNLVQTVQLGALLIYSWANYLSKTESMTKKLLFITKNGKTNVSCITFIYKMLNMTWMKVMFEFFCRFT